jgi:hypothetical protein
MVSTMNDAGTPCGVPGSVSHARALARLRAAIERDLRIARATRQVRRELGQAEVFTDERGVTRHGERDGPCGGAGVAVAVAGQRVAASPRRARRVSAEALSASAPGVSVGARRVPASRRINARRGVAGAAAVVSRARRARLASKSRRREHSMTGQVTNGAGVPVVVDAVAVEDVSVASSSLELARPARRSEVLHPLDRGQLVASFRGVSGAVPRAA